MSYKFCSLCGGNLHLRDDGNLACVSCTFVNYRNPRPAVTALVLHENKLLLTKRLRDPFRSWWDLPGGFLNRGEHPEDAVKRELKEETGLNIVVKGLFGMYTGTFPSDTDPFDVLSIVYRAESSREKLEANDDVTESRWFARDEVPSNIAFDSNQNIMKDFLKTWN